MNQHTAKAALTQMINIVFGKMENIMNYNATADSADMKRINSGISSGNLERASLKPKMSGNRGSSEFK
jgi:hypothetical protein